MSLKIAFVTPGYSPDDVTRGSGTFYYLANELRRQGCVVSGIGPLSVPDPLPTRFLRGFTRKILKSRYLTYLDPWVAASRANLLAAPLNSMDYDILLTNDHGIAAAAKTGKPVVLYTDVMLPEGRIPAGHQAHQSAPYPICLLYQRTIHKSLGRVALAVFPAEWQARDALQYGLPAEKISVIPFGANIPDPGPQVARQRDFSAVAQPRQIELLFVGKDWHRKGGPIAVAVAARLRELGWRVALHVVGPDLDGLPDFVKCHGLLDKNDRKDWQVLNGLYRRCHVFIFPSSSEGSAIVPREAAAYGLPTLAYDIEGLVGSVADGQSGILFDKSKDEGAFVNAIVNWQQNPALYNSLALSSRQFFEIHATWQQAVQDLLSVIRRQISSNLI
jgi:glycosyltransferase involved in cell wall biosynthesis